MKKDQANIIVVIVDRMAPWPFRNSPYLFWSLTFLFSAVVSVAFAWGQQNPRSYLGFCLSYSIGFLTVPLVFRFAHLQFKNWAANAKTFIEKYPTNTSDDIEEWLTNELAFFRGSLPMYLVGAATSAVSFLTFWIADYRVVGFQTAASTYSSLLQMCSAFIAGMGIFAIYRGCRMVWRVGNFRVRVKNHKFGVLSTGRILVQCYFAVAVAWSFYVSSAIVGVQYFDFALLESRLPLLLLVLPTLATIFASFIFCQVPLHLRMIDFKKEQLEKVERILDHLESSYAQKLTRDVRDKISFFENKRDEINSLPEWPFSYKTLVGAIASSVTVIVPALISSLVPIVAKAAGIAH